MSHKQLQNIGFGGGCHWCTEAVFTSIIGTVDVQQGWISSYENRDWSEAVWLKYDKSIISLEMLISMHLETHSCTSSHKLRHKYRSAVYIEQASSKEQVQQLINRNQPRFDSPIITKALYLYAFKINTENYLQYYEKNPKSDFCTRYIKPKLQQLAKYYPKKIS